MQRTILVVDDERYLIDLLTELFVSEGYRVRAAGDGAAALDEVQQELPDLIVTDVMMPRLDGLRLVARLRERGVTIPVILMSAAVTAPPSLRTTFVAKPFDVDHMLEAVGRALATRDG